MSEIVRAPITPQGPHDEGAPDPSEIVRAPITPAGGENEENKSPNEIVLDPVAPQTTEDEARRVAGPWRKFWIEVQKWDTRAFFAINHLPHPPLVDRFMMVMARLGSFGFIWLVIGSVLYLPKGRKGILGLLELGAVLGVTVSLVEGAIKYFVKRPRPYLTLKDGKLIGRRHHSTSFPSGHSANSFACATMLSRSFPALSPFFYLLAGTIAFTRSYLGVHYPGDILVGSTCGVLISNGMHRLLKQVLPESKHPY